MATYVNGVEQVAAGVDSGVIAIWHGTIANIPSGWVICDGNNSTPNLLTKFIEGVATAVTDPGATGGRTQMFETIDSDNKKNAVEGLASKVAVLTIYSDNDRRPLYYDVAFLMKT